MKTILAILLFPCFAYGAADLQKADQLFSKRLYQEALTIYSAAAATAEKNIIPYGKLADARGAAATAGESGLKALYRSAECEALLARYGEAAQRLADAKLPPDRLWQGRLLLLRAETGRQFLRQYGYSLPADEQKGVKDVTKLTSAQWRRLIEADYDSLWDLRGELLKHRLEGQGYFVDLEGAELAYTPTLWDFAVLRWTEYLLHDSEVSAALPPADRLAEPAYRADYSASAPAALKAAAIYEDAAGMSSASADGGSLHTARDFAREYWRLQRLLIPFEHSNRVAAFDRAKLRARALLTLNDWAASFKTSLARGWSFYRAAAMQREAPDYKAAVELCK
ncbi:MAG: hypothetical protein Q8O90_07300, partial [Elusimicrobiota bacterium]|nr:hypothetical protein [Elusimicrobiota bacterium]